MIVVYKVGDFTDNDIDEYMFDVPFSREELDEKFKRACEIVFALVSLEDELADQYNAMSDALDEVGLSQYEVEVSECYKFDIGGQELSRDDFSICCREDYDFI